MAAYGIQKPVFLNETSLACFSEWYACNPPPEHFWQSQADHLTRTFTRGLSNDIQAFIWYTLDGPGWRSGGLLDGNGNPRPSYIAYQNLATRLDRTHFVRQENYGPDIEAYSFDRNGITVHVIWSIDTTEDLITVPGGRFLAAYDRDGAPIEPTIHTVGYGFTVGFSPIFIELTK
jgi:hypothetical protein